MRTRLLMLFAAALHQILQRSLVKPIVYFRAGGRSDFGVDLQSLTALGGFQGFGGVPRRHTEVLFVSFQVLSGLGDLHLQHLFVLRGILFFQFRYGSLYLLDC